MMDVTLKNVELENGEYWQLLIVSFIFGQ